MKILLTGGTGFLGKKLLKKLVQNNNFDVYSLERNIISNNQIGYTIIEINDSLKENVSKINPDIVIHLASYLSSRDDLNSANELVNSNIVFGTVLLDALKETKVKYFINTGTFAEYHYNDGELSPTYLYAATKSAFRNILSYYAKLINFKTVHIIPHTIYGEQNKSKKILDLLIESANAENEMQLSGGKQIFDFIHIDDVVDFYCLLVEQITKTKDQDVYFLGTGKGHSIKNLSILVSDILGKELNLKWGVNNRKIDTISNIAPIAKNISTFNWRAKINLKEGVENYINKLKRTKKDERIKS